MVIVSAVLVAAVAVATYLFDADLSGVRPSFGAGIDSKTGNQVVRDFLAAQDAENRALVTGDQSQLEEHLTGNALQDLEQQVASTTPAPTTEVNLRIQSLDVVEARDPNDPSVVIQIQEDAVKTLTAYPENAAPTQQTVSFHGDFWMSPSNGHYLITDQAIQNQPTSPFPGFALAALAFVWVVFAGLLFARTRTGQAVPSASSRPVTSASRVEAEAPAAAIARTPIEAAPVELVVRTFGGLHLIHSDKDLVAELDQRPVTGFVWQRLMVGTIDDPNYRPSREEIGRQLRPTLARSAQLRQIRNVVYQFRELPAPLKDRVDVDAQAFRFKADACDIDALNLVAAAARISGGQSQDPIDVAGVRRIYDESAGTFLPDFEKAEDHATDHHPSSTRMIAGIRAMLADKRAELGLALARSYIANDQASNAVAVLEPLVRQREDRKDLADGLAAAYRKAGRDAEAAALAARFG